MSAVMTTSDTSTSPLKVGSPRPPTPVPDIGTEGALFSRITSTAPACSPNFVRVGPNDTGNVFVASGATSTLPGALNKLFSTFVETDAGTLPWFSSVTPSSV